MQTKYEDISKLLKVRHLSSSITYVAVSKALPFTLVMMSVIGYKTTFISNFFSSNIVS